MQAPRFRKVPFASTLPLARPRLAAVIGAILLSIVAVLFARAGEWAQMLFAIAFRQAPQAPLIVTPLVFAAVVWATRRWFTAARGSGIPQVMAAGHSPGTAAQSPLVSLRSAVGKLLGTTALLLVGGSAGREGPTVQVSAALMVAVHRWLRVPVTAGVIIAGGAAGVAAAFNTPLAGVAFAIEELASAFEQRLAVLVMAVVMIAGVVSLGLAGDYVYFGAMAQRLPVADMIVLAPLAGIVGGIAGGLFSRLLIAMAGSDHGMFKAMRARPVVLAAGCGLVVAITGLVTEGSSWGTGYDTTRHLLAGGDASLLFGPGKFVSTLATALSGAPGGIFAPSLSVGAGVGQLLAALFPGDAPGAIVVLGMIGYFTGVVRAPLTAAIIIMEMTADRTMILPLFATALIADWASAKVCKPKLYHTLARQFAPAT
ncbi:MAG: chloride channel protein [Novosphingobium sp.]|nr:chloride channel protein [Novosphingobium sp.]